MELEDGPAAELLVETVLGPHRDGLPSTGRHYLQDGGSSLGEVLDHTDAAAVSGVPVPNPPVGRPSGYGG